MRRIALFLLAAFPGWASVCNLPKAGACASGACNLSATAGTWTGSGCAGAIPGSGDTASIADGVKLTLDQDWTIGTSVNSYFSYVSSVSVGAAGSGYANGTCGADYSGGTANLSVQSISATYAGGRLSAVTMKLPMRWYAAGSAQPEVTPCNGGTGASVNTVWQQGSGEAAIHLNASGKIVIGQNRTLTARGSILYTSGSGNTSNGIELQAGSRLVFDASMAAELADGTKPIYTYGPTGIHSYRALAVNSEAPCSATARCAITATGGVAQIGNNGFYYGPAVSLRNVDLSNMGNAVTPAIFSYYAAAQAAGSYDVEYCRFQNSGSIVDVSTGPGANVAYRHKYNTHEGTLGPYVFSLSEQNAPAVFEIAGNAFDTWWNVQSPLTQALVATDNYFPFAFNTAYSRAWSKAENNLVVSWAKGSSNLSYLNGDLANSYWFVDSPGGCDNPHTTGFASSVDGPFRATGNVAECGDALVGDSGELHSSGKAGNTYRIENTLVLPNAAGYSWTEILASSVATTNWGLAHNTFFGKYSGGATPFGIVDLEENIVHTSNGWPDFRSNITFNPLNDGTGAFLLSTHNSHFTNPTVDIVPPAMVDYNLSFGGRLTNPLCTGCTNQDKGYAAKYSTAPGQHDIPGGTDPRFAVWKRGLPLFDQQYLGKPQGTAWSGGATYSVGDIVSHAVTGTYWGIPVNYRYVNGPGCSGANPEPGVLGTTSGTWKSCWEWAVLYWVRQNLGVNYRSIVDGALDVGDGSCSAANPCSVIRAAVNWAKRGYVPQNPRLWGAGHDGKDVGAVHLPIVQHIQAPASLL